MDERIRELAIEAKLIVPEYNGFDPTKLSVSHKIFAALIIKECLLYTNPSPHEGTDFGRGLGWAHQNIKEHFGVEE